MAKFPAITIRMGADVARLRKDLKKGEGVIGSFTKFGTNALMGLTAGAGAAAVALGVDSVKAAMADDKAARKLEQTILNTTKATKEQTAGVEDYITKTMFATGVADDELRPAFARLLRSTNSIAKSQELLNLAMDISAGTGKPLETVVNALGKGYDGNNASLGRLGLGIDAAKLKQKDFGKVTDELRDKFKGFSEKEANTMEGRLDRLNLRFGEAKEQIGSVILEGLEPMFAWMESEEGQKFIDDFVVVFADSMKAVAEALPGILALVKKIGQAAGATGIDFKNFMSPEMMAAAAAFRVALPLGLPAAALAGIAAYAVAKDMVDPAKVVGKTDKTLTVEKMFGNMTPKVAVDYFGKKIGGAGNQTFTGTSIGVVQPQTPRQNVTINVTALSPADAARAVIRAQNAAARMGVSRLSGAAG